MNTEILHVPRAQIQSRARKLATDNGEDPEGYVDYSDLRNGKQRWEYFVDAAKVAEKESSLALLTTQVIQANPKSVAEAVRKTVTLLGETDL
jgi:hypothetical protein